MRLFIYDDMPPPLVLSQWQVQLDKSAIGKLIKYRGRIQRGKKPLEKPPENPPENPLEISYIGKSPKIGSLYMS